MLVCCNRLLPASWVFLRNSIWQWPDNLQEDNPLQVVHCTQKVDYLEPEDYGMVW